MESYVAFPVTTSIGIGDREIYRFDSPPSDRWTKRVVSDASPVKSSSVIELAALRHFGQFVLHVFHSVPVSCDPNRNLLIIIKFVPWSALLVKWTIIVWCSIMYTRVERLLQQVGLPGLLDKFKGTFFKVILLSSFLFPFIYMCSCVLNWSHCFTYKCSL